MNFMSSETQLMFEGQIIKHACSLVFCDFVQSRPC
jgi:hypothetical protein